MLGQMSLFKPDETLPLRRRVELDIVSLADVRYMLEQFHYLHRTRTSCQINYAVLIDGEVDGVITYAYPFISVPLHDVPSDQILEFARLYLHQNIPHSATCAIGKSLRRVRTDWVRLFPDAKEPRLVVSWSDTTRHKGTIYKAANFIHDATSQPVKHPGPRIGKFKREVHQVHGDYGNAKDRWIYWL